MVISGRAYLAKVCTIEREPERTVVAEAALTVPDVALHLLGEGHWVCVSCRVFAF